jgi:hypothetical protein
MKCPTHPMKRCYLRRADALKALRRLQTRGFPSKRVYKCPACGAYHLTKAQTSYSSSDSGGSC